MIAQIGNYVRASYDFPGEAASDLPLSIGDIVKVTDVVDENWAVGQKVGAQSKTGTFPLAFVEHLTLPSVRTGQKVFLAVEDFPAEQNGDLELSKGDIILGLEHVSESWWRGKNGPLKGIFPLTVVAELELYDGLRSRSASCLKFRSDSVTSQSESSGVGGINSGITKVTETTFARALVDVTPQLDGELAFQLGDLIEITDILDDDWFYGKCHNKEGLVSAVCIELLVEAGEGNDYSENRLPHGKSELSFYPVSPLQELKKSTGSQNVEAWGSRTENAHGSYTSENTRSHDAEITPYGRVIYPFTAQIPSELSLTENSIVTLIQHVDQDWTEGEVDGKRGLFPTSFIEIIVDCPYAYSQCLNEKQAFSELPQGAHSAQNATADINSNIKSADTSAPFSVHDSGSKSWAASKTSAKPESDKENRHSLRTGSISTEFTDVPEENHEIGLVLYNFVAEVAGDISVNEGDTVEVIRPLNENWLKIQTEDGQVGQVPRKYVEIIGPWPKAKSVLSEVSGTASIPSAFTEGIQGKPTSAGCEGNIVVKDAVVTVPEINGSPAGQSFYASTEQYNSKNTSERSASQYHTPICKPSLPSKSKPPLLPKPALSPKPIIASKPSSVITQQSFTLTRPSSTEPRTCLPVLENRCNSLSDLDTFIKEEISKAKSGSSKNSDNALNSDHSSLAVSDISTKRDSLDHLRSNTNPALYRRSNVVARGSDSACKLSTHDISAFVSTSSVSTAPTPQSVVTFSNLDCERQGNNAGRKFFANSVSVLEESTAIEDVSNRRKSASFVDQRTCNTPELPTQNSTFVNKAFQMDTPEGVLININDKNILPSRPLL